MRKIDTFFCNAVSYNGDVYYIDKIHNALFKTNYNFTETSIIAKLPSDEKFEGFTAFNIFQVNDELIITSQFLANIVVYSFTQNEFRMYKPQDQQEKQIYHSFQWKNIIYIIPHDLSLRAYSFEITTKEYSEFDWFGNKISQAIKSHFPGKNSSMVIFPIYGSNIAFQVDFEKKELHKFKLAQDYKLCSAGIRENGMVFTQTDSSVVIWYSGGEIQEIQTNVDVSIGDPFSQIIEADDRLIFLPRFCKEIVLLNKNLKIVSISLLDLDDAFCKIEDSHVGSILLGLYSAERWMILPWSIPAVYAVDKETNKSEKREILISEEDYYRYCYMTPPRELKDSKLEDFIKYLKYK